MPALSDLRRNTNEIPRTGASQTRFEESIRIINVTDDLLKSCKVVAQFLVQRDPGIEEAGEGPVVNRANRIGVISLSQPGDVPVAHNLECAILKIARGSQILRG